MNNNVISDKQLKTMLTIAHVEGIMLGANIKRDNLIEGLKEKIDSTDFVDNMMENKDFFKPTNNG